MELTFVIIFMVIAYVGIFFWWQIKKKKSKEAFDKLDMKKESSQAATYLNDLINNQYPQVKKQMKDVPIEAMTVARLEYTAGSQAKDIAKNTLKGLATLGTVRFQTVQTTKYLVLSGSDLHLLDTDTEGSITNHLVYNRQRLLNASIEEMPATSNRLSQTKYGDYLLKSYKLVLPGDDNKVNLLFYNGIVDVTNTAAVIALSNNADKQVKQFVAGNDFLEKLGEKNPNIKVKTYLN